MMAIIEHWMVPVIADRKGAGRPKNFALAKLSDQVLQPFSASEGFALLPVGNLLFWLGVVVLSFGVSVGGILILDPSSLSAIGGGPGDDRDLCQWLPELAKRP